MSEVQARTDTCKFIVNQTLYLGGIFSVGNKAPPMGNGRSIYTAELLYDKSIKPENVSNCRDDRRSRKVG